MSLAETLAPEQIPVIAREYAQQLEFTYGFADFLHHFVKLNFFLCFIVEITPRPFYTMKKGLIIKTPIVLPLSNKNM